MTTRAAVEAELDELRQALGRTDFREFLRYVKVWEPPPGRGEIPFEMWGHLDEMVDAFLTEPLIVWVKARRNGASWIIAAWIIFKAQRRGSYFPLASQGEAEAIELLAKVRFVWEHLPEGMKWGELTTDSRTELQWGKEGSHIQAMPSTGKASRGSAITVGVIDEADYHEYLNAYYYAVKPAVDESGGQLIIVSTVNYETQVSLFKQLVQEAPENRFKLHFHGWRVRKERTEGWYEDRRKEYPDKARFEKEFPESLEQALAPPSTLMAFPVDALNRMKLEVKEPIERVGGNGRIWQKYYIGKRYIAATDTAHGVGADDAVTGIMDTQTGYVVADIQSNLLNPGDLAQQSVELLRMYGEPFWVIEDNDFGRVTIEKAKALGYKRLYYRSEEKPGFHTNEGNRNGLWEDCIEAVHNGLIVVPSGTGLAQFYSVIRNPKKEGRIEAQAGGKDDYPMMVALLWRFRHRGIMSRETPEKLHHLPERHRERVSRLRW